MAGLLLAKVACCGGLILIATGAASGFGAWLVGDGLLWVIGAAVVAAAIGLIRWRARAAATACVTEAAAPTRRSGGSVPSIVRQDGLEGTVRRHGEL